MFIIDAIAYLPVRCTTDEDMESFTKALLTPRGEWNPYYLGNDGQWEYSDNGVSIGSNISATSLSQSIDSLKTILSVPHHKAPTVTFYNDVAFTKSTIDN